MNDWLLREVEAERDEVTRLKAALRAAEERNHQLLEQAEKCEDQMGRMCNALKAAERAKGADQGKWAAKENAWERERGDLLDAYKKCR